MNEIVRSNLNTRNGHLGLGDPVSARILFVGIEQGGKGDPLGPELDNPQHWQRFKQWNTGIAKSGIPIWEKVSKFTVRLTDFQGCWKKYRETELFRIGSLAALVDLRPLARPSTCSCREDISIQEYEEWLEANHTERWKMIREVHTAMKNRIATICCGKEHWSDFRQCFKLGSPDITEDKEPFYEVYKREKLVLTPFLNYYMSDARIDEVSDIIKDF